MQPARLDGCKVAWTGVDDWAFHGLGFPLLLVLVLGRPSTGMGYTKIELGGFKRFFGGLNLA